MKFNINNYEEAALDFLDGNLDPNDERLFQDFLDQHPEVKMEVEGLEHIILVPDLTMQYPTKSELYRKETPLMVPFWNFRRLAAAAAVLVLVSATGLFIWKASYPTSPILSTNTPIRPHAAEEKSPETITSLPVPEASSDLKTDISKSSEPEQPESTEHSDPGVMALEESLPVQPGTSFSAPALASGTNTTPRIGARSQNIHPIMKDSSGPIPIPNGSDLAHGIELNGVASPMLPGPVISGIDPVLPPVSIPNSSDENQRKIAEIDLNTSVLQERHTNTVAYLPAKEHLISMPLDDPPRPTPAVAQKETIQTFKIHIPGKFLSETWGDVSMAQFKKKLLPEFIKNQLNL